MFATGPGLREQLRRHVDSGSMGTTYAEHPVVMGRAAGEVVIGFALYVDGISFTSHDSILGIFIHILASGVRHLIVALRTSEMCGCGCRGWCSMFAIWHMIGWSIECLARGIHPTAREGGCDWRQCDSDMEAFSGQPLGFKAVCVFIKNDLKELCSSLGFPAAGAHSAPCAVCIASIHDWSDVRGLTADGVRWAPHDLDRYLESAQECEVEVQLNSGTYTLVRQRLEFDKRKDGNRGRCLDSDIPALGLKKGDRLEPTPSIPSSDFFDTLRPGPGETLTATFWRRKRETRTRHRNPLFTAGTYLSPSRSLASDWLHCLSLGVFGYWINFVVWALVDCDAYCCRATTIDAKFSESVGFLRASMVMWNRENKDESLPGDLTSGMIGKRGGATSLAGAEANSMLTFLVTSVLVGFRAKLLGDRWAHILKAGENLYGMLLFLRRFKGAPPRWAIDDFVCMVKAFESSATIIGLPFVPKRHSTFHLAEQCIRFGSVSASSTWRDEQINGCLKGVASSAHRAVWHRRVLSEFRRAYGLASAHLAGQKLHISMGT